MERRPKPQDPPRGERGIVLILSLMLMAILSLLGVIFLTTSLTESNISRNGVLSAQAFYVAEAGAHRAYAYLRNVAPDGTVDSSWRTAGWTECMGPAPTPPCPAGVPSYTLVVADAPGGAIAVTSTATLSGTTHTATRKIQLTLNGPTNMGTNAVTTQGTVGPGGVINGNVAATAVAGTTVNGTISGAAPLPGVNYTTLKAMAQAQGYYFVGAVTSSVNGGVVHVSDSYGHSATLPTTFTTTGNDSTGTVNVIFFDNSCSVCNDGNFSLSGNYTLGGLIVAMGTGSSLSDALGGNFTVNGIILTSGTVTQNGGGSSTNTTGSVYAGLGVTLNGSHTEVTFDSMRVRRAGALSIGIKNWTELPPV